jgi:hypothetical protein
MSLEPIWVTFLLNLGWIKHYSSPLDPGVPQNSFSPQFNPILGSMHGSVDQFGCHANQLCLVVTIAMPMSLYKFFKSLKLTWFKDLNLNIYMMHKIVLQLFKICKSHGFFNSKFMDCTSNNHFYVDYATIH